MKKTAQNRDTSVNGATAMMMNYNINDDGAIGKVTEIIARFLSVPNTSIGYVQAQTRIDAITRRNGQTIRIEIKTACGGLIYGTDYESKDEIELEKIMPKADIVLYAPEIDIRQPIDIQLYVFTRNDFINFLDNGGLIRLRKTSAGGQDVGIQTFKTSKKKTNYVYDNCLARPCLRAWLQTL